MGQNAGLFFWKGHLPIFSGNVDLSFSCDCCVHQTKVAYFSKTSALSRNLSSQRKCQAFMAKVSSISANRKEAWIWFACQELLLAIFFDNWWITFMAKGSNTCYRLTGVFLLAFLTAYNESSSILWVSNLGLYSIYTLNVVGVDFTSCCLPINGGLRFQSRAVMYLMLVARKFTFMVPLENFYT